VKLPVKCSLAKCMCIVFAYAHKNPYRCKIFKTSVILAGHRYLTKKHINLTMFGCCTIFAYLNASFAKEPFSITSINHEKDK